MNWLSKILTGGFLKGHRTTVLAVGTIIGTVIQYAVGDLTFTAFIEQAWPQISVAFGLLTAAAHVPSA